MLEFLKEKYHRGKPLSLFLIISHCPQSSQDHCCSESAEHFVDRLSEKGRQLVCQVVKLPQIMLDMCLMQVDIRTAQPVPTKEYISVLVDAVANR